MLTLLSRHVFYPLWDIKDHSEKLQHLAMLEKRQWLPKEKLLAEQWTNLKKTIEYAYQHSAFYREKFSEAGLKPEHINTAQDFRKLPITTKQEVRENLSKMISDEYSIEDLSQAKTGGSTGVSLKLFFDKVCEERRNAAAIRSDRWAGWELGVKRAAIWGNPPVAKTFKEKTRSLFLDRIFYLDTMALNQSSMSAFVAEWRAKSMKAIFGHAHSIFIFAKFLHENNITDVRPAAIVATSMMLLQHERDLIEEVLHCKVSNRYGCEEVGLIGSECPQHEGMHLNIDHLYVEFIREDGSPAAPGEPGKIVLTDFNNRAMPLLRYRVEDVGVPTDRVCSCGRGMPLMERVEGRVADFLKKIDGTQVAGVSLVERTLTKIPGIEQMQLVQNTIRELVVNRVRGREYNAETDQKLVAELQYVFGPQVDIVINDVDRIPQERSGKYRFSICKVE